MPEVAQVAQVAKAARVAQDRGVPETDVEALARGRVWIGAGVYECNLVPWVTPAWAAGIPVPIGRRTGCFEHALRLACNRAGLDRGNITLTVAPHRSLLDRLRPPDSTEDLASTAKILGPPQMA